MLVAKKIISLNSFEKGLLSSESRLEKYYCTKAHFLLQHLKAREYGSKKNPLFLLLYKKVFFNV